MLRQGENSEEGFRGAGSRVGGCEKMVDNLWRGCPVARGWLSICDLFWWDAAGLLWPCKW